VSGMSNKVWKFWRTKSFFSLRLMKTETGPLRTGVSFGFAASPDLAASGFAGVTVAGDASTAIRSACAVVIGSADAIVTDFFGAKRLGCEISTGATALRATITRAPNLVMP